MSSVMKKGKLILVPCNDDDTPDVVAYRLIQKERGNIKFVKLPKWADDYVDLLTEQFYEKYLAWKGNIYEIEEEELSDLYEMKENGNGELEYTVKYNDNGIAHNALLMELIEDTVGA